MSCVCCSESQRAGTMSLKKLPDSDTERLTDLWKNKPVLWDVCCARYSNADDRKAALSCISQ